MTEPSIQPGPGGPDFRALFRASVLVTLGTVVVALSAWILYRWLFAR